MSSHLTQVGGESRPGWPQAGQVGVQHTIFGNARLPHVLHLCTYGFERIKVSRIDEGVGMTVFVRKLSELGSALGCSFSEKKYLKSFVWCRL